MAKQSNELIPPKDDDGVGPAVNKLQAEIFTYRDDENIADRSNRYYRMKRNKHWKYQSKDMVLLSANLIGTHHKKMVDLLTANSPKFDIIPAGDLGDEGEEILLTQKAVTNTWWNDTEQQEVFRDSVDSGEMYGTVGEFGYIDLTVDFPHGDVSFDTMDMLYMSLYPPRVRQQRKAEAFLRWYPMSVREARRKWPDSADEIKSDMSLLEEIGDEREEEHRAQKPTLKQIVINAVTKFIGAEKSAGEDTDNDQLFITEAWVKDYSTKTVEKETEETEDNEDTQENEKESTENAVYPGNIRRVISCNAGEVVLSDEYNPSLNQKLDEETLQENYLYSRWPSSYIQPIPDPSSPFGLSDFEQLEKLNMELNKAMSQFTMFKDKASRLKMVNPRDSGVTDDQLNNVDGIIRPTNHLVAQSLKYIDPPNMGSDIAVGINLYKDLFSEVGGSFTDVTQGQKSGSEVVAAKAIALLLEQEARQAKGKGQAYAKMLRERGRIFLALKQMWGDKPTFVTFKKQGETVSKDITGEDLRHPTKLSVVSGSTLPVSDIYKREEAIALADKRFVDQEYVLKTLGVDNWEEIILRMQQGPLGEFFKKLGLIGVPDPLIQLFQKIGQMEDKEVEKLVKDGKMPPFIEIVKAMVQGQPAEKPDPKLLEAQAKIQQGDQKLQIEDKEVQIKEAVARADIQETQAKIQETNAKVAKINADIELVAEKINSEKVEQFVKSEGVKLDWTNIRNSTASTVADIQNSRKDQKLDIVKAAADIKDKDETQKLNKQKDPGRYDERGLLKSNNVDLDK